MTVFLLAVRLIFSDRALPGVRSGDAALSGKTASQIAQAVDAAYASPQTGLAALRDGAAVWMATPAELGVRIDGAAMAEQATNPPFTANRSFQWLPLFGPYHAIVISPLADWEPWFREQFVVHDTNRFCLVEIRNLEIHFDAVRIHKLGQNNIQRVTRAFGIRPGFSDDLLSVGTDGIVQGRLADTGRVENQITGIRAFLQYFRIPFSR